MPSNGICSISEPGPNDKSAAVHATPPLPAFHRPQVHRCSPIQTFINSLAVMDWTSARSLWYRTRAVGMSARRISSKAMASGISSRKYRWESCLDKPRRLKHQPLNTLIFKKKSSSSWPLRCRPWLRCVPGHRAQSFMPAQEPTFCWCTRQLPEFPARMPRSAWPWSSPLPGPCGNCMPHNQNSTRAWAGKGWSSSGTLAAASCILRSGNF